MNEQQLREAVAEREETIRQLRARLVEYERAPVVMVVTTEVEEEVGTFKIVQRTPFFDQLPARAELIMRRVP